jgi:tetratricopeptide (TPR) repeat protein
MNMQKILKPILILTLSLGISECDDTKKEPILNFLSKDFALSRIKPKDTETSIAEQNHLNHKISLYEKNYNDALSLYKSKRYYDSILKFEEALKIYTDGDIYYHYAKSLFNIGKFNESLKAYLLAELLQFENKRNLYYNISCIYSLQSNLPSSVYYLRLSMENGLKNLKHFNSDSDMNFLKKQSNWNEILSNLESEKNLTKNPKEFFTTENKKIKLKTNSKESKLKTETNSELSLELFNEIVFLKYETIDPEGYFYRITKQGTYKKTKNGLSMQFGSPFLNTNHPSEKNSIHIKNKMVDKESITMNFSEELNGFVWSESGILDKTFALSKKDCGSSKETNCAGKECVSEYEQKGYFCAY